MQLGTNDKNMVWKTGLFVWVPKVAGTSIVNALSNFQHFKSVTDTALKSFDHKGLLTFGHVDVELMRNSGLLTEAFYQKAFKFAFVRNPYDRAISLFHWFRRNPGFPQISSGMSFNGFCKILETKKITKIGLYNVEGLSQANPQADWVSESLNFVGRFENLQDDFLHVCKRLDLGPLALPWKRKIAIDVNRQDYYDNPYAVKVIQYFYRSDFVRFKYSFDVKKKGIDKE